MFSKIFIVEGICKKVITSLVMIGFAVLAFASMGGGRNKSKNKPVKTDFTPVRTTNGFTLKSGPSYHGSLIFSQEKSKNDVTFNSVITYQQGNTTYILPYKYKMQSSCFQSKSSLELFNLKLKIHQ